MGRLSALTVYYCWLCGQPADPRLGWDRHYFCGHPVRWCSPAHRDEYRWLAGL